MKKVYLDWSNCTIIVTNDITNQDEGGSIKFTNVQEMIMYIRQNKNEFDGLEVYDQIGSSDGTTSWEESSIDLV